MSIFFWKKKKDVPLEESAVQLPDLTAEPAEDAAQAEPGAETVAEPEPAVEAEPAAEPEEPVAEPEEPVAEQESAEEPEEPVAEPQEEVMPTFTVKSEPSEEPEPAAEAEPVEESETVTEPEAPVEEAGPAEEPAVEPESEVETEPVPEPEAETERVPEPAAEAEPAAEPEPAAESEQPVSEQAAPEESGTYASSPEQEEEEYYPEKRHRSLGPILIFLLLCVIGWSYYYGTVYAETHFLQNTYINGIDVSGMTSPEVEKILSKEATEYELSISFRNGSTELITGDQIGYKVKPDGSVDQILRSQDKKKWYQCFFRRTDGKVLQKLTYDPDLLTKAVAALPELQKSNMIKPKDAYIELSNTTFSIIPEVEGDTINVGLVQKAAEKAVRTGETSVDVAAIKGSYAAPKVRATDEDIVNKCDSYNKMLAGSITWNLPNGESMTIDAEDTVQWLSVDDEGNYYRDEDLWEEKITFWVDELARNVNTVGKTWYFHATNVGDIEIDGGDYGYSVDKETERDEVWDLLWDGEKEEREPYFYQKQYSSGSGIGGTYIEANLSRQHVWIYIDGEMVLDTDCVSGLPSGGRGTPTGVYQILYKDTDTDLKGRPLANGQYSYISHVDYWMPFYNGCGFHDASWRSSFGGDIYKYDGSHGCINLPPSVAPTFYNYVRTGMPVVVFY